MSEFKIHHHINELFSLLGIDSASAEKYAESLNKSICPFTSSQVSASNAVKTLAEAAPNPELFLNKYHELKNLNVRDLDALVVFLGGLVEEGSIRKVVEGVSHRQLREDGISLNTAPSIVLQIEQDVNTKLTPEDIEELRRRLLKESRSTHTPSDEMRRTSSGEKSNSSQGPPPPNWLNNRPYFSLDFMRNEKAPEVGPLGEVGITTQEHQLIEDLLSLMIGVEGTYITLHPNSKTTQTTQSQSFSIDTSVEPSLRALVGRILPLCSHYSVVVQFVEERRKYHYGQVSQALAAAYRNLLKDYLLLVTQLESHQNRGALTLHKLWFYIEKTLTLMELLACLASSITKSACHGGAVLSLLHERSRSLTGCKQMQEVVVYLTCAAAIPFFRMTALWIYRGIITDPYREFMVMDNEASDVVLNGEVRASGDLSDDYWRKRYTVINHNIPTFLQSLADMVLRTGKYLNVIRESDSSVVCPQQDDLIYSVCDRSYADIIERTYNFASKRLLKLLMDEKDIMGRLRSVKHYFLLDQGDFVVQLLSLCEGELSKNIDDVLPTRLESLLELALRTSVANSDVYKDDVHCSLLPYTLMTQMLQILSIASDDEQEYRNPPERLLLTGLQGFSLTYSVTWPVSLILDRKSHFCYQMIFRHLFYCKYVERLLCRVWVSNKVAKGYSLEASRTYARAFTLRQRMLYFIQNIEYYMMFEVIEQNWQNFISKMQKVESVDEVLTYHSDFLTACLKDCMLMSPQLLRIVSKLTSICVSFANFILRMGKYTLEAELWQGGDEQKDPLERESPEPSPTMEHDESNSFEQHIARFDLQFTGMLITLVDKISQMGRDNYNDAIVNVLYRLDFNNYYTKNKTDLHVEKSPETSLEYTGAPVSG